MITERVGPAQGAFNPRPGHDGQARRHGRAPGRRERAPVETLASRLDLDLELFRACLSLPETDRRLAADVAAGVRDGVRATPSYVVGGVVHSGRLPPELLRPVRAAHGG